MQEQFSVDGEIYIGVVGPVRTGKSTFIKRFMDLLVLPGIAETKAREQARDELPQSAAGKTIMTTEPKFIPKDAVTITAGDGIGMKVRMIDCVGYMVDGAVGHMEGDQERLVKTPWYDYEIPFTKAAEIGTRKVIADHSTIGVVVTSDGSFTEIPRTGYHAPEARTIEELKALQKPFVVILNSSFPYSDATRALADSMSKEYGVTVIPLNCEQLKKEDIDLIMEQVLLEFPITTIEFDVPKWIETLDNRHWLKQAVIETIRENLQQLNYVRDIRNRNFTTNEYMKSMRLRSVAMDTGRVQVATEFDDACYYQILSQMTGMNIQNEYQLIGILREFGASKSEYDKIGDAMEQVERKGYGVVTPNREQIQVEDPVLIRHGGKYGVKIRAQAPSIHLIKATVETEIAPIVGTEEQARDLIEYINREADGADGAIWKVTIFGKTLEQLVEEGIQTKTSRMSEESQLKLQDTMEKIINDGNGGLVCIII